MAATLERPAFGPASLAALLGTANGCANTPTTSDRFGVVERDTIPTAVSRPHTEIHRLDPITRVWRVRDPAHGPRIEGRR